MKPTYAELRAELEQMKQQEAALLAEEYRALVENSPDIIDRFDKESRHLYTNPAGLRLLGLPTDQVVGRTIRETGLPDPYAGLWEDRIRRVFATGEPLTICDFFPTPEGTGYFESRCAPEFGPDGSVRSVLVVTRDISERKRAEEGLRNSEANIKALFNGSSDGIMLLDTHEAVVNANDAICKRLGTTPERLVGRNVFHLMSPDVARLRRSQYQHVLRTGEPRRFEDEREGRIVENHIYPTMGPSGEVTGVAVFARDITEQKKAAEAGRQAELQIGNIVASLPQAMVYSCRVTADGYRKFEYVSGAVQELHGCTAEEAVADASRVYSAFLDEDVAAIRDSEKQAITEEREFQGVMRLKTPDGAPRWVYAASRPRRQKDGAIVYDGIEMDITAFKLAELALENAREELEHKVKERTSRLRSLASELRHAEQKERRRIAHVLHEDVQQHLVAVKYKAHELKERHGDGSVAQMADWMLEEMDRIIELTRDLTTRLSPPVLHELGLVPALEWLAGDMRKKFDLAVDIKGNRSLRLASEECRMFAFDAVRELLMNVTKHAGVKTAHIRIKPAGKHRIALEVRDKGSGFDPAKGASNKFGLFSIRERAAALGVHIEVTSGAGKGTCVVLTLPVL